MLYMHLVQLALPYSSTVGQSLCERSIPMSGVSVPAGSGQILQCISTIPSIFCMPWLDTLHGWPLWYHGCPSVTSYTFNMTCRSRFLFLFWIFLSLTRWRKVIQANKQASSKVQRLTVWLSLTCPQYDLSKSVFIHISYFSLYNLLRRGQPDKWLSSWDCSCKINRTVCSFI